jgi:hypothetical protein
MCRAAAIMLGILVVRGGGAQGSAGLRGLLDHHGGRGHLRESGQPQRHRRRVRRSGNRWRAGQRRANDCIGSTAPPHARPATSPASEVPPARTSPAVPARAVATTATTLEADMWWCSTLSAASSASAAAARPRRRSVVGRPPGPVQPGLLAHAAMERRGWRLQQVQLRCAGAVQRRR